VSLDGSEMIVWLGDAPYRFDVEFPLWMWLLLRILYLGLPMPKPPIMSKTGGPVGVLHGHGSANISAEAQRNLHQLGIESVPVGPGNPKGNGTNEEAFSQMKRVLGKIRLDISSARDLARSVLNTLISVYVHMRNQLPLKKNNINPAKHMVMPVSDELRSLER
jgi:hypothetical protein